MTTLIQMLVLITASWAIKQGYAQTALQKLEDMNQQMHALRSQQYESGINDVAKTAIAIATGVTDGLNINVRAGSRQRKATRQVIMHRMISEYAQNKNIFDIEVISGWQDQRYVAHTGYIAIHHMALLHLLDQRASFLLNQDDVIQNLFKERSTLIKRLHIKDEWLSQALDKRVDSYTENDFRKILGKNFMRRYLQASRGYRDVKDQWLIQIRDIEDNKERSGTAVIDQLNRTVYYNQNKQSFAIKRPSSTFFYKSDDQIFYQNHFYLPYKTDHQKHDKQENVEEKFIILMNLPEEILYRILKFTQLPELLTLRQISQRLKNLSSERISIKQGKNYFFKQGLNQHSKFITDKEMIWYLKTLGYTCAEQKFEAFYHFIAILNFMKERVGKTTSTVYEFIDYRIGVLDQDIHDLSKPFYEKLCKHPLNQEQIDDLYQETYTYALQALPTLQDKLKLIRFNNLTKFGHIIAYSNRFYNPKRSVEAMKTFSSLLQKDHPDFMDIYRYALMSASLMGIGLHSHGYEDDNPQMTSVLYKALAETGSIMFKMIYGLKNNFYEPVEESINTDSETYVNKNTPILDILPLNPYDDLTTEEQSINGEAANAAYISLIQHKDEWCSEDDDRFEQDWGWRHNVDLREFNRNYLINCDLERTTHNVRILNNPQGFWLYLKNLMAQGHLEITDSFVYEKFLQTTDLENVGLQTVVAQLIEENNLSKIRAYFRFFYYGNGYLPYDYPLNTNEGTSMFLQGHRYTSDKQKFMKDLEQHLIDNGMASSYILRKKDIVIQESQSLSYQQEKIIHPLFDPRPNQSQSFIQSRYCLIDSGSIQIDEYVHLKDIVYEGPLFVKAKKVTLEGTIDASEGMVITAEEFEFKNVKVLQIMPCYFIKVPQINLDYSTRLSLETTGNNS